MCKGVEAYCRGENRNGKRHQKAIKGTAQEQQKTVEKLNDIGNGYFFIT